MQRSETGCGGVTTFCCPESYSGVTVIIELGERRRL
jgi:hypothetical protein